MASGGEPRIVATFDYRNAEGDLLYQVVRFDPKKFMPRFRDAHGKWAWGLGEQNRVLYRLPELVEAREKGRTLVLVEGERDVETVLQLGFHGTTSGGANTWRDYMAREFIGAEVLIIPDNDEPGRRFADTVAASVVALAKRVRILELPGLHDHGDISDWVEGGGTGDDLRALARGARVVTTDDYEVADETPPAHTAGQRRAKYHLLEDLVAQRVTWLWPARIPLGKLTVLDGDPGQGKSTLTLDIAARVSTHSPMPDGTVSDLDGPRDVILLNAEDGPADTIRPRADAANADVKRIVWVTDVVGYDDEGNERMIPWMMPRDLDTLRALVVDRRAALVVIDPMNAFLSSDVDGYRDQDVRGALRPLERLAEETGAAVVVVRHLSKGGGTNALYRGGGSIGIIGAARSALLVAPNPDDDSGKQRLLAVSKSNVAEIPATLSYELVESEEHGCARVRWTGTTEHQANELLAIAPSSDERSEQREAEAMIRDLLSQGEMKVIDVYTTLERTLGISRRTVQRAAGAVKMQRRRHNEGRRPVFFAFIPGVTPEPSTPAAPHRSDLDGPREEDQQLGLVDIP